MGINRNLRCNSLSHPLLNGKLSDVSDVAHVNVVARQRVFLKGKLGGLGWLTILLVHYRYYACGCKKKKKPQQQ